MPIYEFDPDQAPDSDFEPATLEHLVPGNRGRLLDARRTPIVVTGVFPLKGAFEIEINAFEDAGARWELGLDQMHRFQFDRGGSIAPPQMVEDLGRALARIDHELTVAPRPAVRQQTVAAIRAKRGEVRRWLDERDLPARIDLQEHIAQRNGNPALFALVDAFIAERGLAEHDNPFTATFASNPGSGEVIKGYAIVLAELGLCPYRGKAVRDPELFNGAFSKEHRAEYLVARFALTQELWSRWGSEQLTLYRAAAVEGPWARRDAPSFVSATFSRDIAEDHFMGGATTDTAVMWRQRVPVTRLLMTFLETSALNARYREAEAILIGDPGNLAF